MSKKVANPILRRLTDFLSSGNSTLLGIGPISKNCVDSVIELSGKCKAPLILISSRRQIDAECLGGGYSNNWTTEDFSQYVKLKTNTTKVLLARDHGGPWQNSTEISKKLNLNQAMESAKKSFEIDINSGFNIIHIDTSLDINKTPSSNQVIDRAAELIGFCSKISRENNKEIIIEVGTEEQAKNVSSLDSLYETIIKLNSICNKNNFISPSFIVAQTGTKVLEMKNVGELKNNIHKIKVITDLLKSQNIFIKEHNTDYLPTKLLNLHPQMGVHAANVAPEFGVVETKAFVSLLKIKHLSQLADKFLKISYDSNKWKKWMLPNTTATDYEKALISGHYIFSTPSFLEIKKIAQDQINFIIDEYLKDHIKMSINRYLKSFNLLN